MIQFGLGEFYSLACALAWAIAVVLFKKSGESLAPFALNLFKNLLALVLLVLTWWFWPSAGQPSLSPLVVALALLSGLLGIGIGDTLYLQALNRIGAARLAIAGTLYSPFVILLSLLFLGERLGPGQWLGVALVLAGVLQVNRPRSGMPGMAAAGWGGILLAVAAVALMAAGIVMAKPLVEAYDFLLIVILRLVGGVLGMALVVLFRRNAASLWRSYAHVRHWPQLVMGSLMGTYVAMLLWLAGYKYTTASVAAVLNEMAAVFILLLAAAFLHDRLRRDQIGGALVACAGVLLVVWR